MDEIINEKENVVTLKNINLRYQGEKGEVTALKDVNLNIKKG